MAKVPAVPPLDNQPVENPWGGDAVPLRLKIAWQTFFNRLQRIPAAAIPDVPASPTNAQLGTALNAVLAVLRSNNFIED